MQRQQQLCELDYHAKQYQKIITNISDNTEFAGSENDNEIFILSDGENSNTDSEIDENHNESINNIYTVISFYSEPRYNEEHCTTNYQCRTDFNI